MIMVRVVILWWMRSFTDLDRLLDPIPRNVVRNLTRTERAAGREDRYASQLPAMLETLSHRARIESVRASSAIEDIIVDQQRLQRIVRGAAPRTRGEEEVAGYRDALDHLFGVSPPRPFDIHELLRLHRLLFGHTDSLGGRLKTEDNRVIEQLEDGQRIDRFRTVPARQVDFAMRELHERLDVALRAHRHHPILVTGAYILDLLVIHPFDNGNGRTARLATTAILQQSGFDVVRYVAVEGLVDRTSNEYYRTLKASTEGWHDEAHDLWPWLEYLTGRIAEGYEEFDRLMDEALPTGSKSDQVEELIRHQVGQVFTRDDLRRALPHVSDATINRVLQQLRKSGVIRSLGRGVDARWERTP